MQQNTAVQHNEHTRGAIPSHRLLMAAWLSILMAAVLTVPIKAMAFDDGSGDVWESRSAVRKPPVEQPRDSRRDDHSGIKKPETQRFVLHFHDDIIQGHGAASPLLFLKKELHRQYPGIDVSSLRLREVVLVAKTMFGRGTAELRVGPRFSGAYRIAGRPDFFHSSRKQTFDKVAIVSPYPQSWGPWQLKLQGLFSVRKIVLVTEQRPIIHGGGYRYPFHQRDTYFPRNGQSYTPHSRFN